MREASVTSLEDLVQPRHHFLALSNLQEASFVLDAQPHMPSFEDFKLGEHVQALTQALQEYEEETRRFPLMNGGKELHCQSTTDMEMKKEPLLFDLLCHLRSQFPAALGKDLLLVVRGSFCSFKGRKGTIRKAQDIVRFSLLAGEKLAADLFLKGKMEILLPKKEGREKRPIEFYEGFKKLVQKLYATVALSIQEIFINPTIEKSCGYDSCTSLGASSLLLGSE